MGGKRLTDKEKRKIISDYVTTQNRSETARMNNVNEKTVRRIIANQDNKEMQKKAEQKKEENTRDILKYMDSIYEKQKKIIDLSLSALEEKLKNPDMFTNVKDIATVYGVIFDKALKYKEIQLKDKENSNENENLNKVKDIMISIKRVAEEDGKEN